MAFRVYIAQALGSVKDIQIVSNSVKDVIDKGMATYTRTKTGYLKSCLS